MAHTFKVGDIVRGISDKFHILGRDMKLGEITFVGKTYFTVKILEHDCLGCRHLIGKSFASEFPDRFELVEAASPISRVLYNPPATVVFWSDGTKTVAKCAPHERFDREKGLAICCAKKLLGEGYADAFKEFREPQNRVLSREEVFALKFGVRVWVEYRTGCWSIPTTDSVYTMEPMLLGGEMLRETQTTHEFITLNRAADDGYFGRKYRVWLLPRKPTDAELRANPWKREGCE